MPITNDEAEAIVQGAIELRTLATDTIIDLAVNLDRLDEAERGLLRDLARAVQKFDKDTAGEP